MAVEIRGAAIGLGRQEKVVVAMSGLSDNTRQFYMGYCSVRHGNINNTVFLLIIDLRKLYSDAQRVCG